MPDANMQYSQKGCMWFAKVLRYPSKLTLDYFVYNISDEILQDSSVRAITIFSETKSLNISNCLCAFLYRKPLIIS